MIIVKERKKERKKWDGKVKSEGVLGALPQALRDYEPGFFIPHFPQSREPFRIPCFAESEGFEPPDQLPGHRISSAARSTTPATFLWSI